MLEDSEDANMLLGNQEPRLKAVGCKPRARRKICRQARKKGKRVDKASVTSASNALHPLVGHINEEMTYEQCQLSSYPNVEAF